MFCTSKHDLELCAILWFQQEFPCTPKQWNWKWRSFSFHLRFGFFSPIHFRAKIPISKQTLSKLKTNRLSKFRPLNRPICCVHTIWHRTNHLSWVLPQLQAKYYWLTVRGSIMLGGPHKTICRELCLARNKQLVGSMRPICCGPQANDLSWAFHGPVFPGPVHYRWKLGTPTQRHAALLVFTLIYNFLWMDI
jgi:hypothetical protein